MERQSVWQETFNFFAHRPIVVEPVDAHLSTDAGLLPIRQLDEALGLTDQFAGALMGKAAQASPAEAEKLYHEIGLEMIKDRIIIPTVNPDLLFVYRKNITGVRYDISSELPLSEFGKK